MQNFSCTAQSLSLQRRSKALFHRFLAQATGAAVKNRRPEAKMPPDIAHITGAMTERLCSSIDNCAGSEETPAQ
ncbi:hypothetical protein ACELLULO517_11620 [Acidisoma cellulosilytica]|uniref:Uncharacterized protein n=1 Tax=Acidisoma cellulosilyticum TaxID=2802395 RepID=A0A963Z1M2_9PROT|nr:hypothetical protein [Acidisoma cellulosilyticum]MCB8880884.1 hypothetical protein [Acidisoma cellulosilyticum]